MTKVPLPFDIADAFSVLLLQKYAYVIRNQYNLALIWFTLRHYEAGDLGFVTLRKIDENSTDTIFSYPPYPSDDEINSFMFTLINGLPADFPQFEKEIINMVHNGIDLNDALLTTVKKKTGEYIYQKRLDYKQKLINIFYEKLKQEHPAYFDDKSVKTVVESSDNSTQESFEISLMEEKPWEYIPDHYGDRTLIKLWCEGYKNSEISHRVYMSARAVTNRISELRKIYPFIPTNQQRWKRYYHKTHDNG